MKRGDWRVCVLTLLVFLLVGCSDPLYEGNGFSPTPTNWELVTTTNSSRYEWRLQNGRFVVSRPPPMAYLTSMGEKIDLDDALDAPLVPIDDLNLSEHAKKLFADIFHDAPKMKMKRIFSLPINQIPDQNAFDLSSDGKRFVAISPDQDALVLYDSNSGKRIGEMELPGNWNDAPPTAVRFCGLTKDFLVASPSKIVRLSGKDGSIVGESKGCGSPIKRIDTDWLDTTVSLLTESGELFLGTSDLSEFEPADTGTDRFNDAVVSKDGKRLIAGSIDQQPKFFQLENSRIERERRIKNDSWTAGNPIQVIGGIVSDVWMDEIDLLIYMNNEVGGRSMFWRTITGVACSENTKDNWLLIAGERMVNRERQTILFAYGPRSANHSAPVIIDELPKRIAADQPGGVVALYDSKGVHVSHREIYHSLKRKAFSSLAFGLLNHQDFDDLESTYAAIGRQKRFAAGIPPSAWQSELLKVASRRWNYLDQRKPTEITDEEKSQLKRFQAWYETGSVIAKTVSAERHERLGWDARGNGYANTVSQNGWQVFEKETRLAIREVESILEADHVPALAFEVYIGNVFRETRDFAKLDPIVRRAVLMHPGNTDLVMNIVFMMLPQWGGEPGEAFAFIGAHASLFAGEYGDIAYTDLVRPILSSNSRLNESVSSIEWRTVDTGRIARGLRYREKYPWPIETSHYGFTWMFGRIGNRQAGADLRRYIMHRAASWPTNKLLSADISLELDQHFEGR